MFGTYRAALAIMVVALHYARLPYIGNYAVFGFFGLSGYLMTFIMQKNYGYTMHGVTAYALNRFLRIYPLYWVSCIVSLAILLLLGSEHTTEISPGYEAPENFVQWSRNIILLLSFEYRPSLNIPVWALTIELFFYVCIGLGLSRSKRVATIWFSVSVAFTLYLVLDNASFGQRYSTISAASLPFSTGAIIFHWRDEIRRFLGPIANHAQSPAAIFSLIIVNWMVADAFGGLTKWGFYSNYLLCAIMIVVLFHRRDLPFISRKWDSRLGDLSYPIYLLHYPLGFLFLYVFKQIGLGIKGPEMSVFLLSLPVLLLLSWLMAVGVEQRVEVLRNWVKRSI